jgi:hypothetical protein
MTEQIQYKRNFGSRGCKFFATDRDKDILLFIWRWKLASTATVHEVIGGANSPYATYKALDRLEEHKLVEAVECFDDRSIPWQLTSKGFATVQSRLGELCEEGYLSENRWHDRNIVAFHLGEWATHRLPIVTHWTEQEMRRRTLEYYPDWMPRNQGHRADGYTLIEGEAGRQVLVFEVELSPKPVSVYESVLKFYGMIRNLNRVYWLVGDKYVKDQILRAKTCINDDSSNFHVFVDQADYIEKGWDAAAVNERSQTLFTLRENIQGICGGQWREYLGKKAGPSRVSVHYDPRKVLGKKRAYKAPACGGGFLVSAP